MRYFIGIVAVLLAGWVATQAYAQKSPRRPGLWEVTTRTLLDGTARERSTNLDKLNEEERANVMEQMRKNGIRLVSDTAAGRVIQVCVSQEQATKEPEFFGPTLRAVGCRQQEVGRLNGGKTVLFEFVCEGKFVGSGRGETTLDSPESYFGWTETRTTAPDGMIKKLDKPVLVRNEIKGRWLRERCPSWDSKDEPKEAGGKTKPKAKTAP